MPLFPRSAERLLLTRRFVCDLWLKVHVSSSLKVLDATLKEITAALLESDVNIKLVASLRQKVKTKVKASLEAADKTKENNRKNLVQKVFQSYTRSVVRLMLFSSVRQYSMNSYI
jgi:signal recognition particle GTPase